MSNVLEYKTLQSIPVLVSDKYQVTKVLSKDNLEKSTKFENNAGY